jgi:hypothetical protein
MLDATKPTDVELVSALPLYIRENRISINSLLAGSSGDVGTTDLTISGGTTTLTVGTDLGNFGLDIVIVDADAAVNISNIYGGTQGQMKTFIFQDNNISIVDGLAAGGAIYLNQLPALSSFAAQTNDILTLVNIGGNGSTVHGYWKEIGRQIALK